MRVRVRRTLCLHVKVYMYIHAQNPASHHVSVSAPDRLSLALFAGMVNPVQLSYARGEEPELMPESKLFVGNLARSATEVCKYMQYVCVYIYVCNVYMYVMYTSMYACMYFFFNMDACMHI